MFLPFSTVSRQLADSLPLRITCIHQCSPDTPIFQFYRAVFVMMMNGTNNKMRLQTHVGSSSCEVRYRLLGYGIPVDCTCSSIWDQYPTVYIWISNPLVLYLPCNNSQCFHSQIPTISRQGIYTFGCVAGELLKSSKKKLREAPTSTSTLVFVPVWLTVPLCQMLFSKLEHPI
jgi:hypothetical protein